MITRFTFLSALICACVFSSGCMEYRGGMDDVRRLLELAKKDNVSGQLKIRINPHAEVGMRQGFYLSSPGSSAEADLKITLKDVEPVNE